MENAGKMGTACCRTKTSGMVGNDGMSEGSSVLLSPENISPWQKKRPPAHLLPR